MNFYDAGEWMYVDVFVYMCKCKGVRIFEIVLVEDQFCSTFFAFVKIKHLQSFFAIVFFLRKSINQKLSRSFQTLVPRGVSIKSKESIVIIKLYAKYKQLQEIVFCTKFFL